MIIKDKSFNNSTYIMGIINLTPDSFYAQSRANKHEAIARACKMVEDGADVIDIGACSTRPNHTPVSVDEELHRLLTTLKILRKELNVPISVDTYRPEVAHAALDLGADMINDVYGLQYELCTTKDYFTNKKFFIDKGLCKNKEYKDNERYADNEFSTINEHCTDDEFNAINEHCADSGLSKISKQCKKNKDCNYNEFGKDCSIAKLTIDDNYSTTAKLKIDDSSATEMFPTGKHIAKLVKQYNASLCIMHNAASNVYKNLFLDIRSFFERSLKIALQIDSDRIILDGGMGFAKDKEQNFKLLENYEKIAIKSYPLLLGTSRKRMFGASPEDRLQQTLQSTRLAVRKKVLFVRVHDVLENKKIIEEELKRFEKK